MLGTQDGWAYAGSSVKANLYRQAKKFFAKQNRDVVPLNSVGQDASFGQYASAEMHFRCVAASAQGG